MRNEIEPLLRPADPKLPSLRAEAPHNRLEQHRGAPTVPPAVPEL